MKAFQFSNPHTLEKHCVYLQLLPTSVFSFSSACSFLINTIFADFGWFYQKNSMFQKKLQVQSIWKFPLPVNLKNTYRSRPRKNTVSYWSAVSSVFREVTLHAVIFVIKTFQNTLESSLFSEFRHQTPELFVDSVNWIFGNPAAENYALFFDIFLNNILSPHVRKISLPPRRAIGHPACQSTHASAFAVFAENFVWDFRSHLVGSLGIWTVMEPYFQTKM